MPHWSDQFCGGYPYSHYHWNDANPFGWTLRIVRNAVDGKSCFVEISPHISCKCSEKERCGNRCKTERDKQQGMKALRLKEKFYKCMCNHII